MSLKGSCACGLVQYVIRGDLIGPITYCHCWRCRKHSGSSFGTTAGVQASHLSFVSGEARLSSWESSPRIHRYFAACCGSPIFKSDERTPAILGFRLGTLDSDPQQLATLHYMVNSKVPWAEISDELSQESGGDGPFGTRN